MCEVFCRAVCKRRVFFVGGDVLIFICVPCIRDVSLLCCVVLWRRKIESGAMAWVLFRRATQRGVLSL